MNKNAIENNKIEISGEIVSNFEFSHETYGERFYTSKLASERTSGSKDVVEIVVSERLIDVSCDWVGQFIRISGNIRARNKKDGEKTRLLIYVFARDLEVLYDFHSENVCELDGYICKTPIYRETPLGREITDVLIAVNRNYGKSDYIPCICWGRNAKFSGNLEVGTHIFISGRLQSREYTKKLDDETEERRTAYEVSAISLSVVSDE